MSNSTSPNVSDYGVDFDGPLPLFSKKWNYVNCCIALFGIIGNITLALAVTQNAELRKQNTTMFIVALATTDGGWTTSMLLGFMGNLDGNYNLGRNGCIALGFCTHFFASI